MLARSHWICYIHDEKRGLLKMNSIDELLKHRISGCVNMFCKRQIELPSKATGRKSETIRGEIRLNDERIKFSCPMARSSQFPCHGPFRFRVHVEIESQVRHTALREAQVESKTRGAFLTFDAKAFELCDSCFDEI